MRIRPAAILVLFPFATAAFGAGESYPLKLTPKAGEVHRYRQATKFEFNGNVYDTTAVSTLKVIEVTSGSFTIKEQLAAQKVNGMDPAPGQESTSETTTYSARGEILKIEGEGTDGSVYRSSNLGVFISPAKPVQAGESWTYDIKEDKSTGAVAAEASYTLMGEEKLGSISTFKIKYLIKEIGPGGASGDGMLWLNKSDCSMVKLIAKWINAPVPGGNAVSGSISWMLIP